MTDEFIPGGGAGEGAEEDDEYVRLVDAAEGGGAVAFRRQSTANTQIQQKSVIVSPSGMAIECHCK